MNVLLTGSEGYLGTLAGERLLQGGHQVRGVDAGYYVKGWLYQGVERRPEAVYRDIRDLVPQDLAGFDAVVHMAELSNDPLGALSPSMTYEINHRGSVHLARMAREAGVARFVYMSSCSVYGIAEKDVVDESAEVNPQTAYAECKVMVERDVGAMADESFSPVFLRNATAFGASPRMRFDIVLNNLAGWAFTEGEIRMTSDGTPWRPLVHARDIVEAVACALEAPREAIHNQVFNVGSNENNYRVRDIAEVVAETFPGCELTVGPPSGENRSYRVAFDKISTQLPGFRVRWDAARGAEELRAVFESMGLDRDSFQSPPFTRLRELERLLATGQLGDDFRWRRPIGAKP